MLEITNNINQELIEQVREYKALFHISQMLAQSLDLPTILRQIVDASVSLIPNAEQSVIHLVDETKCMLKPVAVSLPDTDSASTPILFKAGEGIAGLVIANGKTINVIDTLKDERFLQQDKNPGFYRSLLVAPIKMNENTIGTLSVESSAEGAFSEYNARLLTSLGEQAALAIERAQLLQEEQEQRQLAEVLREVSNVQGRDANLGSVLKNILILLSRVLPYDTASVFLIDNNRVTLVQRVMNSPVDDSMAKSNHEKSSDISIFPQLQKMLETQKPIIIQDALEDAHWVYELESARSWIGAPIQAKGRVIAILSLYKAEIGFYEAKHIDKISAFASQASLTIQNSQLFETIQKRLREVNLLYRISQLLAESFDVENLLHQVSNWLQEQFNFYFVQVILLEGLGEIIEFRRGNSIIGFSQKSESASTEMLGIPGYVARTNQPFVSNNVTEVPFFVANDHFPNTSAELAIPLRTSEKLMGVLDLQHQAPNEFKDDDLQLLYTIAEQITLAVEKALIYDDLQRTLTKEQAARTQLVQSEKLAALGRIVASVAHELNNPLQAIQNALYLINMEEKLNNQSREDLRVAINEANRMAGLISRLRETYRPTVNEEFQPCSINDLVTDVEKLISTHLNRNKITFDFLPDPHLPDCLAIPDQMKQVILNVCLNAVESMPEGGDLHIQTRFDSFQGQILLDISDNGLGISPDVLPYIFDPFVTTKERGTGLGLAITYDIVRRHGGQIEPESKLGSGTTFHVRLPVNQQFTHKKLS